MPTLIIYLQDEFGNRLALEPWIVVLLVLVIPTFFQIMLFFFKDDIRHWGRKFIRKTVIFTEDFNKNTASWNLNLWNSSGNDSANRIEKGHMKFESQESVGIDPKKGFLAYIDLDPECGIIPNTSYKVSAVVSSTPQSSMKFQLWVHNSNDKFGNTSVVSPEKPTNLSTREKTYNLNYKTGTNSRMRIHLNAFPGDGEIFVTKVKVEQLG